MRQTQTLIALLLFAAVSFAQPPVLVLTDADTFIMTMKDGAPFYQKIEQVIDWRAGGGDIPGQPGVPKPPEPERTKDPELTKKVKAWAEEVNDPQTSQALALIYRMVNDAVKDKTLTNDQGIEVLKNASDEVLTNRLRFDHWEPFREKGSAEITFRRQTPNFDFPMFLVATAHGLESAADNSIKLTPAEAIEIVSIVNSKIDEVTK